jgi:hypothetical protein
LLLLLLFRIRCEWGYIAQLQQQLLCIVLLSCHLLPCNWHASCTAEAAAHQQSPTVVLHQQQLKLQILGATAAAAAAVPAAAAACS